MFRFFARNRHSMDRRNPGRETGPFTILPGGRASVHADGVVFLNVEKGVIFKANQVGSRIWQGVQNQESPAAMAAHISREYRVPENQAAEDTAQFLAQLETEGFIARHLSGSQS